jgi:hypothetical protein
VYITYDDGVQMPYQPSFSVSTSSNQDNLTYNTAVTVNYGAEIFDQGANFASNTFTAPLTGKYLLSASLRLQAVDSGASYLNMQIITSNRSYFTIFDPRVFDTDSAYFSMNNNVVADMDAGDTAYVTIYQAGGTNSQIDISGSVGATRFTGIMIG